MTGDTSSPDAGGSQITLAWLGHSTVVIDLDGVRIITDPLLRRHVGPLRRRGPRPSHELWAGSDVILLSHLHHDHAELSSLRRLAGAPVLTAAANARWLRRRGIPRAIGLEDGWTQVGGGPVEVRLTEAVHRHRPMPHRPNAANGHLVRGSRISLWAAGDTSLFDGMAQFGDLLGRALDIAVVPIAGWGPRLSEGHMDAGQAAIACARTHARWALPVHWGSLHPPFMSQRATGWMDSPGPEFATALEREAPGCRLIDLRPGEVWHAELDSTTQS